MAYSPFFPLVRTRYSYFQPGFPQKEVYFYAIDFTSPFLSSHLQRGSDSISCHTRLDELFVNLLWGNVLNQRFGMGKHYSSAKKNLSWLFGGQAWVMLENCNRKWRGERLWKVNAS